jgi:hypothetical protein
VYAGSSSKSIALAVESMRRHTADAGWQIMQGLELRGYTLCGHKLSVDTVNVREILDRTDPGIVVVQDKREWDPAPGNFREKAARFQHVSSLKYKSRLFTLTIVKDAHHRPNYHQESANEMGVNAWIIYYHPRIVRHVAPYIREEHVIRTYHSIRPEKVPPYSPDRKGCLLSGAVSSCYPLRRRLIRNIDQLPDTHYKKHPGYGMRGCLTPQYLKQLSEYKVAICTSSIFGYTLRKLMEATACGCIVVTDLPPDDPMPEIDGNLVRVPSSSSPQEIAKLLKQLYSNYDPEKQKHLADKAKSYYSMGAVGKRLANDIEHLRQRYNA